MTCMTGCLRRGWFWICFCADFSRRRENNLTFGRRFMFGKDDAAFWLLWRFCIVCGLMGLLALLCVFAAGLGWLFGYIH